MKTKNGQVITESLIALGITAIALIALISGVVITLKNIRNSKQLAAANHYASQTIENARAYKQSQGFDSLGTGTVCYGKLNLTTQQEIECTNWGDISGTSYKRRIKIEDTDTNQKTITVTIAWQDSDCNVDEYCHQTQIKSYITNWK